MASSIAFIVDDAGSIQERRSNQHKVRSHVAKLNRRRKALLDSEHTVGQIPRTIRPNDNRGNNDHSALDRMASGASDGVAARSAGVNLDNDHTTALDTSLIEDGWLVELLAKHKVSNTDESVHGEVFEAMREAWHSEHPKGHDCTDLVVKKRPLQTSEATSGFERTCSVPATYGGYSYDALAAKYQSTAAWVFDYSK